MLQACHIDDVCAPRPLRPPDILRLLSSPALLMISQELDEAGCELVIILRPAYAVIYAQRLIRHPRYRRRYSVES